MDPRIGFLHGDARAPNPLALDVAELFKCYFSEHSLVALSHEGPRPRWFAEVGEGVYLNEIGKKEAAHIFDEKLNAQVKHTGLDRHLQFREIMVAEAYKLEKDFLGIEEYKPTVVECTLSSSTICR
jgi:CRISPR-associated protein Cas1